MISDKTLNWIFTILFVILLLYLITVFVSDIVDRRISNVEVRVPMQDYSGKQKGGVAVVAASPVTTTTAVVPQTFPSVTDLITPAATVVTPFTAPVTEPVAPANSGVARIVTPVTTMTTYAAVPSAIPVPVVTSAVSTATLAAPFKPIVGLPTPSMTSVPLGAVPAAAAASGVTVAPAVTTAIPIATTSTATTLVGGYKAHSRGYQRGGLVVDPAVPGAPVAIAPLVPTIPSVPTIPGVPTTSVVTPVTAAPVVPAVAPVAPAPVVPAVAPVAPAPMVPAVVNTYYKDPDQMTPEQRQKFKEHANFSKMTLEDYKNWLDLWRNDEVNLVRVFPAHVANFRKYISGLPVLQSDLQLVITSVIMPVAVKTPGLDTAQGLYNRFFLGDQYVGAYPEVFSSYPNVTTIPLQIATTPLPMVIS